MSMVTVQMKDEYVSRTPQRIPVRRMLEGTCRACGEHAS